MWNYDSFFGCCRACGQVFCSDCTKQRIRLPQFGYTNPERVCENCFQQNKMRQVDEEVKIIFCLRLTFCKAMTYVLFLTCKKMCWACSLARVWHPWVRVPSDLQLCSSVHFRNQVFCLPFETVLLLN